MGTNVLSAVPPRLSWFNQKTRRCCDGSYKPASLVIGYKRNCVLGIPFALITVATPAQATRVLKPFSPCNSKVHSIPTYRRTSHQVPLSGLQYGYVLALFIVFVLLIGQNYTEDLSFVKEK